MRIHNIKYIKILGLCHKEDTWTPQGPLTRETYPTYPSSVLSQNIVETNKRNHFKEIKTESPEILIENSKPIKALGFFYKEDILAHLMGSLTR